MERWFFTLFTCLLGIPTLAQIQVPDASVYDTILHKTSIHGVEHIIGIQKDAQSVDEKGSLAVFIHNAEEDDIIGATVQVMDGERQVTGGVTDYDGFLFLPNIHTGTYEVKIRHIISGEKVFSVEVDAGAKTELIVELENTKFLHFPLGFHFEQPMVISVADSSVDDSLLKIVPRAAVQTKGGLKVFITNAEEYDIIGATVQVMDGERQVTGGVTDFTGFLYLPNIEAGTYTVKIRHIAIGEKSFEVTIKSGNISELKKEVTSDGIISCGGCCWFGDYIQSDPFVTSYTTDQILRTP